MTTKAYQLMEKVEQKIRKMYSTVFEKEPNLVTDVNETDFSIDFGAENICLNVILEGETYHFYPQSVKVLPGYFSYKRGEGCPDDFEFIDLKCKNTKSADCAIQSIMYQIMKNRLAELEND